MIRTTLLLACAALASAQSAYKQPPESIRKILSAPATPLASVNPTRTQLLLLTPDRYPPISELAQPMLRLAGLRINPKNNGPRTVGTYREAEIIDLGTLSRRKLPLPPGARLGAPQWSPNGRRAAFLAYFDDRIELFLLDAASAALAPVPGVRINAAYGSPVEWLTGSDRLIIQMIPAGRGAAPQTPSVPAGPEIQESGGRAAPAPTYQDLLQTAHDEELFAYYATSQLAVLPVTGRPTPFGAPAIYGNVEPAPDGQHVLVQRTGRPFSRVLPVNRFPLDSEIWKTGGGKVATIARLPLAERIPIEGVRTGPRQLHWQPGAPATLAWWEALDGGNPKEKVPHRDRMLLAPAPFANPKEFVRMEERLSSSQWTSDGRLWASDYNPTTRVLREYLVDPSGSAKLIQSRNRQDRYRNPGSPVTFAAPSGHRHVSVNEGSVLLNGAGAGPAGDRPFLDRWQLGTESKTRLFESAPGAYEFVVSVLDPTGSRLLIRSETPTSPPNYFLIDSGKRTPLTSYADPAPELRQITRRVVEYKRPDGVPLHFTLYLPPGYKEGTPLPTVVWAYPQDFADASTAGQISGSPNRFTTVAGASHLFFLLEGYAILDDASLPVLGNRDTFNNTYVEQIVAGAKAAIDKAVELGVTDPKRVGVGGHSYGAFMTANLLAHSDLFAAGIARSGAYNRTLTPFGFQTERRTLWEAPETYLKMSPFLVASKINEPILLIHGAADNNTGTFPIQSERMYTAVRGNGGVVRYVVLPHESHGYAARESVEHTLAEMIEWFNKHVKHRAP